MRPVRKLYAQTVREHEAFTRAERLCVALYTVFLRVEDAIGESGWPAKRWGLEA